VQVGFDSTRKICLFSKRLTLPAWVRKPVTTIGWPITEKTVHTKEGDPMKFVSFEDSTALYQAVFFPKVYHHSCHLLSTTRPFILKERVEESFGAVTLNVHWMGFLG